MDSDHVAMERNIRRLKEEQNKSRNQDASVLQNLLSVTFGTRHQQLLQVSYGKSRVSKLLKDWPIFGKEIYVCCWNIFFSTISARKIIIL